MVVLLLYREIDAYFAHVARNPVETSVSLRAAEEVPFPAVVLDMGDAVDPLGFVRASRNVGDEDTVPQPGKGK